MGFMEYTASPDGKRLAIAAGTAVPIWDLSQGKNAAGTVNAVTWSPNGQWIASSDYDGNVHVWQAPT
jgi:WD40 repeat protein